MTGRGLVVTLVAAAVAVACATAFAGYRYGVRERTRHAVVRPSPTPSPTDTACFDTAQTQVRLNECAAAEAHDAEATLDAVLADARAQSTGANRAVLDRAQRQWAAYRGTFCDSFAPDDGSLAPMNFAGCRASLALDRARDVCFRLSPNSDEDAPPSCRRVPER